jgi:hypothetical protein
MCSYKKTYINTVFINFQFHVCNGNNSLAFMAQLHNITVTCSSSHDPKFKKLSLSLSLSIYIYIYILGAKCKYPPTAYKVYIILSIYIYKEERTENRRCKMKIPTNHAYKVYIILWRSLFNLFILHD